MKDQNVALMEKRLAELNNLKVGDKVKVQSGDKKKTLEVEIIGIYETNEQAMGQQAPLLWIQLINYICRIQL